MAARLATLRDRARKKKLPFDLELKWLSEFLLRNNYNSTEHHIDRICSIGGYTKSNLQILSIGENIAKGNRERHGECHMV